MLGISNENGKSATKARRAGTKRISTKRITSKI